MPEARLSSNMFFVYGGSCLAAVALKVVLTLILCREFSWEGIGAGVFFTLLGLSLMRRGYNEVRSREENPADVPEDAAPAPPAEHDHR